MYSFELALHLQTKGPQKTLCLITVRWWPGLNSRLLMMRAKSTETALAGDLGGFRHRSRAVLTREMASTIFCQKGLVFWGQNGKLSLNTSKILAKEYGVSPKTIRDIWNGRTWNHVTASLRHFQDQLILKVRFSLHHARTCHSANGAPQLAQKRPPKRHRPPRNPENF